MLARFYKLMYDVSFYFSFASFVLIFFKTTDYSTNPWSFLLLSTAMFGCILTEKILAKHFLIARFLRTVCILFPGIFFIFERNTYGTIEIILPWIYWLFVYFTDRLGTFYEDFREHFMHRPWAFIVLIIAVGYNLERGAMAFLSATPYIIVFLASGVLLLQNLRWNEKSASKKKFEKNQIRQLGIFGSFCVLLTVGNLLEWIDKVLIRYVLLPIGKLFGVLFASVFMVVAPITNMFTQMDNVKQFAEQNNDIGENTTAGSLESSVEAMDRVIREEIVEETPDFTVLYVTLGVIAFVILLVLLIGKRKDADKSLAIFEEREDIPEEKRNFGRRKGFFKSNSDIIRAQYGTFMKITDINEHLKKADTTEEIRDKYIKNHSHRVESANTVTGIYREVRYGETVPDKVLVNKMKEKIRSIKA